MDIRSTAYNAARMAHRWPWRPGLVAGAVAVVGLVALRVAAWTQRPGDTVVGQVLLTAALAMAAVLTGWWWLQHVSRPRTTKVLTARRLHLSDRHGGVATRLDIAEVASPAALRRKATVLRPSLTGLPWRRRILLDPRLVGVELARLGLGWAWGGSVWSSVEDVTLWIGGPRTGKTTALIRIALDAQGALLTTSTRLDLAEGVHTARTARGPVHFFNPTGLGGLSSTVRWRVLDGCADFTVACRRADDLIPASSSAEAERWDTKARLLLGLLLHAAAVSGRGMSDVRRWATGRDEAFAEVRDALLAVRAGGRERMDEWRDYCHTNDKTRTSISNTMGTAVAWVSDDRARELGDAPVGDPRLIDVRGLIERGETLHLIGGDEGVSRIAPLISALTAEIAHTARLLASHQPGGRLDPPLTMILDEAAIVTPLPLDRWSADMGGRGVTMHISAQSTAQLRGRWGETGAKTLLGNVACRIAFGGSTDDDELTSLSTLVGQHLAHLDDDDRRYIPVMTPAEIRALGIGQAIVLRRGLRPVVAWTTSCLRLRGWQSTTLSRPLEPSPASLVVTTAELEAIPTLPDVDRTQQ